MVTGTWLDYDFPYIGNLIPTDELHHFSEGLVETTNQMMFGEFKSFIYTKLGIQLTEIGIHHYQQGGLTQQKNWWYWYQWIHGWLVSFQIDQLETADFAELFCNNMLQQTQQHVFFKCNFRREWEMHCLEFSWIFWLQHHGGWNMLEWWSPLKLHEFSRESKFTKDNQGYIYICI